ncbi:MAG: CapA family protein [Eubacteriales bacterium]
MLDSADKVIINLETPLAPDGVGAPITKSGPALISDPSWVDFLEEAGCGLAVMANNHTGDYGEDASHTPRGCHRTLDTIYRRGI